MRGWDAFLEGSPCLMLVRIKNFLMGVGVLNKVKINGVIFFFGSLK